MREGAATSSKGTPCWRGARREFMMTLTSALAEREGERARQGEREDRETPGHGEAWVEGVGLPG